MSRIEVKICGLNRLDDATAALDLGADYIGFVLYAGSPRYISAMKLARLLDRLPTPMKAVGVFVNESRAVVEKVAADCNLFAVQLNGDERSEEFSRMKIRVWRSIRLRNRAISPSPADWRVDRYVLDSVAPGLYGGTGRMVDWKQASMFAGKHRTMLAGGLTPDNVADAIQAVHPAGVDVASGVERNPRRKDRTRMKAFIENARQADTAMVARKKRI